MPDTFELTTAVAEACGLKAPRACASEEELLDIIFSVTGQTIGRPNPLDYFGTWT